MICRMFLVLRYWLYLIEAIAPLRRNNQRRQAPHRPTVTTVIYLQIVEHTSADPSLKDEREPATSPTTKTHRVVSG